MVKAKSTAIKRLMDKAGCRQVDLARAMGVNRATVHNLKTGKQWLTWEMAEKAAEAAGWDPKELMGMDIEYWSTKAAGASFIGDYEPFKKLMRALLEYRDKAPLSTKELGQTDKVLSEMVMKAKNISGGVPSDVAKKDCELKTIPGRDSFGRRRRTNTEEEEPAIKETGNFGDRDAFGRKINKK